MGRSCYVLVLALCACDKVWRLDNLHDGGPDSFVVDTAKADAFDEDVLARFDFEADLIDAKSGSPAMCLATATSCPTFKPGHRGSALQLDGADDCLAFNLSVNPTSITIAAWVNKATDTSQSVISKPYAATSFDTWQIDTDTARTLRFITYGTSGGERALLLPDSLVLGAWQHIAVVFDAQGNKHAYFNGQEAMTSEIAATMTSDSSAMLIGCDHDTNTYSRFFAGMLDEVVVYKRALTAAEISLLASID